MSGKKPLRVTVSKLRSSKHVGCRHRLNQCWHLVPNRAIHANSPGTRVGRPVAWGALAIIQHTLFLTWFSQASLRPPPPLSLSPARACTSRASPLSPRPRLICVHTSKQSVGLSSFFRTQHQYCTDRVIAVAMNGNNVCTIFPGDGFGDNKVS